MLEHMSPWEYTEVRKVLGHGSGFDSPGFREIRRVAPAARRGVPRCARASGAVARRRLHRAAASSRISTTLAEQLIELDERVIVWRVRHFKVVQRVIGARRRRHAGHAGRGDGPADPQVVLPRALGRPQRPDEHEPARVSFSGRLTRLRQLRRHRLGAGVLRPGHRRRRRRSRSWTAPGRSGLRWFDTARRVRRRHERGAGSARWRADRAPGRAAC